MEEKTAAAGEPNAARHECPHGARLSPVDGEEEQRRHVHREVGRVDRAGAYLAPSVGDAHRPGAATRIAQQELGREGEAACLGAAEVLRHPAHHGVDALGADAAEGHEAHALRRPGPPVDRGPPLAGGNALPLAVTMRVVYELLMLDSADVVERFSL